MAYVDPDCLITAIADPTRRKVFEAVRAGPRAVGDIARDLPVSRSAVSQHLKVLSDAGLVTVQAEGTRRIYAVDPQGLVPLRAWLDSFWGDVLAGFADEVQNRKEPQ